MSTLLRLGLVFLTLSACDPSSNDEPPGDGGATGENADGSDGRVSDTKDSAVSEAGISGSADSAMSDAGVSGSADSAAPDGGADPSALDDAGGPDLPAFPVPELSWRSCGPLTVECSSIEVPLDYREPGGRTIELPLKRVRAYGTRKGAVFVNPGGPGASAVAELEGIAGLFPADLRLEYDVIAVEPRGVSGPDALDCHSTLQELIASDKSPDDEEEWLAVEAAAKTFADECGSKHADLLPHFGTLNVARDMDLVRAALGVEQLSYVGFSYGTELGAWYAELFPHRVKAMVLDGAVSGTLSALELALAQAKGFERGLNRYLDWCDADAARCGWTGGRPAKEAFALLVAEVDHEPLAAWDADRDAGPGELDTALIYSLYGGESDYRWLSSALDEAVAGDATAIVELADEYYGRDPDGDYPSLEEVYSAVLCGDSEPPSPSTLRAEAARFAAEAPYFGVPALTTQLVCAYWPAVGERRPTPPMARGAAPIVVIGTTGDPATPYAWAEALSGQLESAVLLTREGEGHTAYGLDACIDAVVNAYLLEGTVPSDGTRCESSTSVTSARILPPSSRHQVERPWWRVH